MSSTSPIMKASLSAVVGVALSILAIICVPQLVENTDARNITVIQSPIDGELSVYTEPGWKWQGFGKVTTYPRRTQFNFASAHDLDSSEDRSITTRFNDGGHGDISGTVNWQMPLAIEKIIPLHRDFGSFEAIEQQLIRTSLQKVIYNVGPTMSSTESSAEKRPNIPQYIDDQLLHGPYQTKTVHETQKDPITGQDKLVAVVQIATDKNGKPLRESHSPVTEYGIQLQPVAIISVVYDETVEKQIKERQTATTQVQIAIANAKKAEQDTLTITEQGKAAAAKAKWEQETLNAREIAEAEKNKKVADLAADTAALYKERLILEGQGESEKKRLIMEADGALDPKIKAYIEVNTLYAKAIENARPGAWSPSVVMGDQQGKSGSSADALVSLFTAKTAKDLGLDLTIPQGATVK